MIFEKMIGKIFTEVIADRDSYTNELRFSIASGEVHRFLHRQDCCENVEIEDICGDISDLVGAPILEAEEVSNYEGPAPQRAESYTWTFYRFSTVKGTVTVRWLGTSNGYYSESVYYEVENPTL